MNSMKASKGWSEGYDMNSCEICIQAKKIKSQNQEKVPRMNKPLARVYIDFWGPYTQVPNQWGYRYYLSIMDSYSHHSWIFLMKDRSYKTLEKVMDEWLVEVE